MIIRHAEKPSKDGLVHGVNHGGSHDKHDLCVRGWQRAGALVRFFDPHHAFPPGSPIATPRSIFAAAATELSPSLRSQHTVLPLALALGLPVNADHPEGEEERVAEVVRATEGPVLIAWHHKRIPHLARAIAGEHLPCPRHWPDERYDVVWVLERTDGEWRFVQAAQRVLHHDHAHTIPLDYAPPPHAELEHDA